jgi:hypothetical protein
MEHRAPDHLNPRMREFLAGREMVFISTADGAGVCHASFQAGPPGFVRILDDRTVLCPAYSGAGVAASLGDIAQNAHVCLLFVDPADCGASLRLSGRARLIEHTAVEAFAPLLRRMSGIEHLDDVVGGRRRTPEQWVLVNIVEAHFDVSELTIAQAAAAVPARAGAPVPAPAAARAPAPVGAPVPAPAAARAPAPVGAPVPAPAAVPALAGRPQTGVAVDDDELSYLLPPAWAEVARR